MKVIYKNLIGFFVPYLIYGLLVLILAQFYDISKIFHAIYLFLIFIVQIITVYIGWQHRRKTEKISHRLEEKTKEYEKGFNELFERANRQVQLSEDNIQAAKDIMEEVEKKKNWHVIQIPNNLKTLFIESMVAFESYSKLKGYEVVFSFENTETDKLGFKFIVQESSNVITNDEVRSDIRDFMEKIKNGEEISNLPVLINSIEHIKVLTILNNKLNTIRHNAYLERNLNTGIEDIVEKIIEKKGFSQSIHIYNQQGGDNNSKHVEAVGSNINQGDNNSIIDNSINIHHSFNEKKTIIEKIDNSIKIVQQDDKLNDKDKEVLELHLKNIKHEIEEESQPDASRLKRYWEKIKGIGERAIFSHELSQALSWIGEKFNFVTDFLKNIPS